MAMNVYNGISSKHWKVRNKTIHAHACFPLHNPPKLRSMEEIQMGRSGIGNIRSITSDKVPMDSPYIPSCSSQKIFKLKWLEWRHQPTKTFVIFTASIESKAVITCVQVNTCDANVPRIVTLPCDMN